MKVEITRRVFLVGEANPYGEDPQFALYPDPPQSAGGRLCRGVLGMRMDDYLRVFERRNLCPSAWSLPLARDAAYRLIDPADPRGPLPSVIVMLGAKVTSAFRSELGNFAFETRKEGCHEHVLARIPHPSGRCRLWEQPGTYQQAREFLRQVLPPAEAKWIGSAFDSKVAA